MLSGEEKGLMLGNVCDVDGVRVGHATDSEGLTGCTVTLFDRPAVMGVEVRGASPGSRETDALNPMNALEEARALLLTGGSTFGLAAADGVMCYLEERQGGQAPEVGRVPSVPGMVIFDLRVGSSRARPDSAMGYRAASEAESTEFVQGNVGAGTGASAAKMLGMERAVKGGLGSFSVSLPGGMIVAALVVVNPAGEVRDPKTAATLVAPRLDGGGMADSMQLLAEGRGEMAEDENTTIGLVVTNATLTKAQATRLAWMAHDGLARTIYPVHTLTDGDAIFAAATGELDPSETGGLRYPLINVLGSWGAHAVQEAILEAVRAAKGIDGMPAYADLPKEEDVQP